MNEKLDSQEEQVNAIVDEEIESGTTFHPPQEKDVRWMTDYTLLFWEIKAKLLGGYVDRSSKGGGYIIKKSKNAASFIEVDGIEKIMAILGLAVTKIQGITQYDAEEIGNWDEEIDWTISKEFFGMMERREYGMDISKADIIKTLIMSSVDANMKKSLNGASMQAMMQSEKVIVTRNEAQQQNKKFGFF